jgi:hypothetical protein
MQAGNVRDRNQTEFALEALEVRILLSADASLPAVGAMPAAGGSCLETQVEDKIIQTSAEIESPFSPSSACPINDIFSGFAGSQNQDLDAPTAGVSGDSFLPQDNSLSTIDAGLKSTLVPANECAPHGGTTDIAAQPSGLGSNIETAVENQSSSGPIIETPIEPATLTNGFIPWSNSLTGELTETLKTANGPPSQSIGNEFNTTNVLNDQSVETGGLLSPDFVFFASFSTSESHENNLQ